MHLTDLERIKGLGFLATTDEGIKFISADLSGATRILKQNNTIDFGRTQLEWKLAELRRYILMQAVTFTAQIAQLLEIDSSCLLFHSHGSKSYIKPEYFTEKQIRFSEIHSDALVAPLIEIADRTSIDSIFVFACDSSQHAADLAKNTGKTIMAADGFFNARFKVLEDAYAITGLSVVDLSFLKIAQVCMDSLGAEKINTLDSESSLLEEACTNKGVDIPLGWNNQLDDLADAIKKYHNGEPFQNFPDGYGTLRKFHPNGNQEVVPPDECPNLIRENNLVTSGVSQKPFVGELPSTQLCLSEPTTSLTPSTPKMSLVSLSQSY